jgi:pimeloyl-ACP methyl ester carboxylesterase
MRAALTAPDRVLALILIDTQAGPENPDLMPGYEMMMDAWTAEPGAPPPEIADGVAHIILGDYAGADAWKAKWGAMEHAKLRQVFSTLAGREDLHDRLAEIHVPALVVHAEDDIAIEMAMAERLAAGLPQGELAPVSRGGHAANLANPGEVNPHIERFLAKL